MRVPCLHGRGAPAGSLLARSRDPAGALHARHRQGLHWRACGTLGGYPLAFSRNPRAALPARSRGVRKICTNALAGPRRGPRSRVRETPAEVARPRAGFPLARLRGPGAFPACVFARPRRGLACAVAGPRQGRHWRACGAPRPAGSPRILFAGAQDPCERTSTRFSEQVVVHFNIQNRIGLKMNRSIYQSMSGGPSQHLKHTISKQPGHTNEIDVNCMFWSKRF